MLDFLHLLLTGGITGPVHMAFIPILMAAMAGAKAINDQEQKKSEQRIQAETTRYSPWTGMQAATPGRTNPFGTLAGGIAAGSMADGGFGGLMGGGAPKDVAQGGMDMSNVGGGMYGGQSAQGGTVTSDIYNTKRKNPFSGWMQS